MLEDPLDRTYRDRSRFNFAESVEEVINDQIQKEVAVKKGRNGVASIVDAKAPLYEFRLLTTFTGE